MGYVPTLGGHLGRDKTMKKISSIFHWEGITNVIREYIIILASHFTNLASLMC